MKEKPESAPGEERTLAISGAKVDAIVKRVIDRLRGSVEAAIREELQASVHEPASGDRSPVPVGPSGEVPPGFIPDPPPLDLVKTRALRGPGGEIIWVD